VSTKKKKNLKKKTAGLRQKNITDGSTRPPRGRTAADKTYGQKQKKNIGVLRRVRIYRPGGEKKTL